MTSSLTMAFKNELAINRFVSKGHTLNLFYYLSKVVALHQQSRSVNRFKNDLALNEQTPSTNVSHAAGNSRAHINRRMFIQACVCVWVALVKK